MEGTVSCPCVAWTRRSGAAFPQAADPSDRQRQGQPEPALRAQEAQTVRSHSVAFSASLSGRGPHLSQGSNSLRICFPAIFLPPAALELPCSGGGSQWGLQLCQERVQQGHLLPLLMVLGEQRAMWVVLWCGRNVGCRKEQEVWWVFFNLRQSGISLK